MHFVAVGNAFAGAVAVAHSAAVAASVTGDTSSLSDGVRENDASHQDQWTSVPDSVPAIDGTGSWQLQRRKDLAPSREPQLKPKEEGPGRAAPAARGAALPERPEPYRIGLSREDAPVYVT
jgi:hypothetical protein